MNNINESFTDWLQNLAYRAKKNVVASISILKYLEARSLLRKIKKEKSYNEFLNKVRKEIDVKFPKSNPDSGPIKLGHQKGILGNMKDTLEVVKKFLNDSGEKIPNEDRQLLKRWTNDAPLLIKQMEEHIGEKGSATANDDDFNFDDDFGDDFDF